MRDGPQRGERLRPSLVPFRPSFADEHPAFSPYAALAARFAPLGRFPSAEELDRALSLPVRFVAQGQHPRGPDHRPLGYHASITEHRVVPTRPSSWHDFFVALVWAVFPHSKRLIHALYLGDDRLPVSDALRTCPTGRTRANDALALLDEGGLLVAVRSASFDAHRCLLLAGHTDAVLALVASREARAVVIGHALLEHLAVAPTRVRGAALAVPVDDLDQPLPALVEALDASLSSRLGGPGPSLHPDDFARVELSRELFEGPLDQKNSSPQ